MFSEKHPDILQKFFLNSVPKSGTNLLTQLLLGMPKVSHSFSEHQFFNPYDYEGNLKKIQKIKHNEFAVGHMYYSKRWAKMLTDESMKSIFIYRDLRDIVVSYTYFIVEKPQYHRHQLYHYFTNTLKTNKDRYLALIHGIDTGDMKYPTISQWFTPFLGWLGDPNTLCITYESLVGSEEERAKTLTRVVTFLWEGATPPISIPRMVNQMSERGKIKRGTFRQGKIGSWNNEFDHEVKEAFKSIAGDLLMKTGYENNKRW
jgi:hypothetical protein